jgi:3-hydroxyisobutyrate dehydrogenase-like beta-hydroxyacid dehydrogenase
MERRIALIGFGEAAQAFVHGMAASVSAYDRKTDADATRPAKLAEAAALNIALASTNAGALAGAPLVLSLVTADQALAAAEESARGITAGALFCDMNSVSPDTKRDAAARIEAAGARYVDVAVMAPVYPLRRDVPLLVAGPHATDAAAALAALGFGRVRALDGEVGQASAIKMIRSVMVKGLEALTAECLLAAEAAGVRDEVIASLDASERARPWTERGDYNLDRMMVHGLRRAEEMAEVVRTLDALGTGAAMSRGTAERQRAIGALGLAPPNGLAGKLAALLTTTLIERAA